MLVMRGYSWSRVLSFLFAPPLVSVTNSVLTRALKVEFDTSLVWGFLGSSSFDGTGGWEEPPLDGVPSACVLCCVLTLSPSLGYFQASMGTYPSKRIP